MISSNPALTFVLLGPPQVLVNGRPLTVDTRKAVALACYLVISEYEPTRDELVALFWPELDHDRGRAGLRRTLSALRSGLGGRWLTTDRERVKLDRNEARVDLKDVDSLSRVTHGHTPDEVCPDCTAPLGEAVALYRGAFMDGFYLRDAPGFEEWQRTQAEVHRRRWRELVGRWALALASAGRFVEAESVARRRIQADPLDEGAHRQVMQFLVWAGDRVGALRQYRECAAILDRELGVAPLPETRSLYEMIMEGIEPLPPAGRVDVIAVSGNRAFAPDGAFVGRLDELEAMSKALSHMVIEGEEGIGKTRLIDRWLDSQPGPVAKVKASPGTEDVPYIAIRDLLVAALSFASGPPPEIASEAVRLLPELSDAGFAHPPVGMDGPGAAAHFHAGVTAALHHLLQRGWIVIDDAHWLDASSIAILTVLLTHSEPKGARVLLSWRSDQVDAASPFSMLLRRLEREGEVQHITLGPLSDEEARELLRSRRDDPAPEADAERVIGRAKGNPLFLISYQDAAGSDRAELPADLERLVETRLDRLGETSRQVLSAASILGSEADATLLQKVSGRGDDEMVAAIEELMAHRLIQESGSGVTFTHDAIRRAVVKRVSKARSRILHSRAADALAGSHHLGAISNHLEEAGRNLEAASAHFEAGREAMSLHAYEAGRTHLSAAAALGLSDRNSIGLLLGEAAVRLGDYGAALGAFATVSEGPEVEYRIGEVYMRLRRWQLAEAALSRAVAMNPPPDLRTHITADRAVVAHQQGDDASASRMATLAREEAEAAGDLAGLAQAANLMGMLAPTPKLAIRRLTKAHSLARSTGRPELIAATLNNLALAHRAAGDLEAAVAAGQSALAVLEPLGDRHQLAALHNNLADTLHLTGREEDSRRHLTDSVRLFADVGLEPGSFEPEIWKLSEW